MFHLWTEADGSRSTAEIIFPTGTVHWAELSQKIQSPLNSEDSPDVCLIQMSSWWDQIRVANRPLKNRIVPYLETKVGVPYWAETGRTLSRITERIQNSVKCQWNEWITGRFIWTFTVNLFPGRLLLCDQWADSRNPSHLIGRGTVAWEEDTRRQQSNNFSSHFLFALFLLLYYKRNVLLSIVFYSFLQF